MYVREMGCEPKELAHWLPSAMGDYFSQTTLYVDGKAYLNAPNPLILLEATTLPARQIALVRIPVTRVVFTFPKEWDQLKINTCLARFDLYTRRGGG